MKRKITKILSPVADQKIFGRPSKEKWNLFHGGFTLLEILVALSILAIAMMVITSSFSVNLNYAHRNRNLTIATFLIHEVVYDLERKLLKEPFPENTTENQACEISKDFRNNFKCTYDLVAINLTDDQIMELSQNAMTQIGAFTGQDTGEGGNKGKGTPELPFLGGSQVDMLSGLISGNSSSPLDISTLMQFAPLLGDNGLEMMNLCQINIEQALMNMMGFVGFFPQLIKDILKQTRKLVVRLEWEEGPKGKRKLEIETYIISLEGKQGDGWEKTDDTGDTGDDKTNNQDKKLNP